MPLNAGTRLGPYEVRTPLGAGGMGEVYIARDPRLGRDVAVKVLPASLASDPERLRRFEEEARAIASLSHPNVLAIYDVGTDDPPFLVTELLEGETLRARIDRGALSLKSLVDVAQQFLAGLSAAHARGLVHRDLKPDNIFITRDGVVKILDFGLAKTLAPINTEQTTVVGTNTAFGVIVGTVGYMAPEQLRAEPADQRSDIFAAGAVLFEMASGRRAFQGGSAVDTMSAVLSGPTPDLTPRDGLPPALGRIVRRCLEKNRDDRFQSSKDLHFAIESMADTAEAPLTRARSHDKSIAVLPFADMSASADQAYFCEGMAEEIINALAGVEGLRVAPRTSTFHCAQHTRDLGEIAKTLGVDTVLEGSVKTSGRRLRVTAQLIDIADARAIWSQRFDGDMTDVFAIQDDISSRIVGGLRGRLIEESLEPIRRHTGNLEAYDHYLRGRHHRFTTFRLVDAMQAFQQAVGHDPTYAPALAGLGDTAITLSLYGLIPPIEAKKTIHDAIAQALASDANLAVAHACLGRYTFYFEHNWIDALRSFERALLLGHHESEIHGLLAICHGNRLEEAAARRHIERALAIDPLSAWNRSVSALVAYNLGHLGEAAERAHAALDLRPDSVMAQWILGASLTQLGRGAEAVNILEGAVTRVGPLDYLMALLAGAYFAAGDRDRAETLFSGLELKATKEWVSAAWLGMAACGLGRSEIALDHLARACAEGDPWSVGFAFPLYDSLRGNSRLLEIVRHLNLPESIIAHYRRPADRR